METLSKKEKRSESKKRKAKAFLQLAKEIEEVINFSSCPTDHHIFNFYGNICTFFANITRVVVIVAHVMCMSY
jgi:hypothetical protein